MARVNRKVHGFPSNMSDPNVAVIIPTHDRPELLKRAIQSALRQEKKPAEVIVVNDGGPVQYADDPLVKMIATTGGVGPTKGRALAMTVLAPSTNAICYLDDDDELLPNHVRLLSEALSGGAQFAFSKAIYRYANGFETEDPEPGNKDPNKRYYDPNALLSQNIAPVSSFIHTRKAYDRIGGWDESLIRMEDWDFWGRMFIEFGPPTPVNEATNVIYKGLGTNRTDSNPYVYAMGCHWGDFVRLKLSCIHKKKNGHEVPDNWPPRIPRLSVIMPVYNAEKYLPEALDSLAKQTYEDFEVIAINDGSTDSSGAILEQYFGKMNGKELRVFNMPSNQGVTRALNHGLLMSRTEYVARMDSDDVSMPERFERQVAFLDKNKDIGMVGTWFWSMDENLTSINWANEVPTSPEEIRRTLLDHCCIGHPTVMMRRKIIETVGGYGGYNEDDECKAVEDYEMWLRVSRSFRIANLPEYLLKYREYDSQVTKRLSFEQKKNFEMVREKYRKLEGAMK